MTSKEKNALILLSVLSILSLISHAVLDWI